MKKQKFYALLMRTLSRITKIEQSNEDIIINSQKTYDDIQFNILKYIEEPF